MNSPVLSRLRRARWVHGLQLLVFTCWVANPFPGAFSYWTDTNGDHVKEEVVNPPEGDSWFDQDSDGDGLTNAQEALFGSDPYQIDADFDGLTDQVERDYADPAAPYDPWNWDSDEDGYSDHDEFYQRLWGYQPLVNYATLSIGSFYSYSDADGDGTKNPEDNDFNVDRDLDGTLNWLDGSPMFNGVGGQWMDDSNNGVWVDPGVYIGGNWYPSGTVDSDYDGTPDHLDATPYGSFWYNGTEYGGSWQDSDNDGTPDVADAWPYDSYNGNPPPAESGFLYNGNFYYGAWSDSDSDGIPDVADGWPYDATNGANYYYNGTQYSGYWTDSDSDGIPDAADAFPNDPTNGAPPPPSDSDGDGVPDGQDSHGSNPALWNDFDGDGRNAENDSHPDQSWLWSDWNFNYTNNDSDGDEDGHPDAEDSHPRQSWLWSDWNGNGSNDAANEDSDGDGRTNEDDSHPTNAALWSDWNFNGTNNESDGDEDGHTEAEDSHPRNPNLWSDWDFNGSNSSDADGDGWADAEDSHPHYASLHSDWNGDGDDNDADGDEDGTANASDSDPRNASLTSDTDGDGRNADADSHPQNNQLWSDWDGNGINNDFDGDEDGWGDGSDSHPRQAGLWNDFDGDNVNADHDSHPADAALWSDWNGDADNNDTDWDEDAAANENDSAPYNAALWSDWDGNGVNHDTDGDEDGAVNELDSHPHDPAFWGDWNFDGTNDTPADNADGDARDNTTDSDPRNAALWSDWNHDGTNHATDGDEDGVPNVDDSDPFNPLLWSDWNHDGDDNPDDMDEDSWPNTLLSPEGSPVEGSDSHPRDPALWSDWDGNGMNNDADGDEDGILNANDSHPRHAVLWSDWDFNQINNDTDGDEDGVLDSQDSDPRNNTLSRDWNHDGDDNPSDWDEDGHDNGSDSHPANASLWNDFDGDGVNAENDSHPQDGSLHSDWNNDGDNHATDGDEDGALNLSDSDPRNPALWIDWNHDGYNDGSEPPDDDADGIPNSVDNFPNDPYNDADSDMDGLKDYDEVTTHGTNRHDVDSDDDFLTDYEELLVYHTNPTAAKSNPAQNVVDGYLFLGQDSDGDGLPDLLEEHYARMGHGLSKTDPADAAGDLDGDGITNVQAYHYGWSLVLQLDTFDTDGDRILDVVEDAWAAAAPGSLDKHVFADALADFDNDGVMNFEEVKLGLNLLLPSSGRADGLTDLQVLAWALQLGDYRRESDYVRAAWEQALIPEHAFRYLQTWTLDWATNGAYAQWSVLNDGNADGVPDGLTYFASQFTAMAPVRASANDGDGDGMDDVWEYRHFLNPRGADGGRADMLYNQAAWPVQMSLEEFSVGWTDYLSVNEAYHWYQQSHEREMATWPLIDPDGDTLGNLREFQLGTNPRISDTDGDGYNDLAEVQAGTNATNAGSNFGTLGGGGGSQTTGGGSSTGGGVTTGGTTTTSGGSSTGSTSPPAAAAPRFAAELVSRSAYAGLQAELSGSSMKDQPFEMSGPDLTQDDANARYNSAKLGAKSISADEAPHEVAITWEYYVETTDPETGGSTGMARRTKYGLKAQAQEAKNTENPVGGSDPLPVGNAKPWEWRVAGIREVPEENSQQPTGRFEFYEKNWAMQVNDPPVLVKTPEEIGAMTSDAPLSWLQAIDSPPSNPLSEEEWMSLYQHSTSVRGSWTSAITDDDQEHYFPYGEAAEVRLRRTDTSETAMQQPITRTFLRITQTGDADPVVAAVTLTIEPNHKISTSGTGPGAANGSIILLGKPTNNKQVAVEERLEPLNFSYHEILADGSLQALNAARSSLPSPTVDVSSLSVEGLTVSSSQNGGISLSASIQLAGLVDDALADVTPGPNGKVQELYLLVNGTESYPVPLQHQKQVQEGNLRKCQDYTGTFSDSIPGVRLSEGANTLKLIARNLAGMEGYSLHTCEIQGTSLGGGGGSEVSSAQFSAVPSAAVSDSVVLSVPAVGLQGSFVETAPNSATYSQGGRAVSLLTPAIWSTQNADAVTLLFSSTLAGGQPATGTLMLTETGADTLVFQNQDSVSDSGVSYAIGAVTFIEQSKAGEFHPMLCEIKGLPPELAGKLSAQFPTSTALYGGGGTEAEREFVSKDGGLFLSGSDKTKPGIFVLTQGPDAASDEDAEPDLRDASFGEGFSKGFISGGAALINDGESLITSVKDKTLQYWNLLIGEGSLKQQIKLDAQALLGTATSALKLAMSVEKFIRDRNTEAISAVVSLITGDSQEIKDLGGEYAEAFSMAAEVLDYAAEEWGGLSEGKKGYYMGRLVFEIASCFCGAAIAKVATKAQFVTKLVGRPFFQSGKGAGFATKLVAFIQRLFTTKMCFVAGTLVMTQRGLQPIERITAGEVVWSRNEVTHAEGWQPVVDTFTTHPDTLHTLRLDADGDGAADEETLTCTGEHPFWVVEQEAFVPAAELRPGWHLLRAHGSGQVTVVGVETTRAPPGQLFTTYNFEVATDHTYFVGESGVWVHNKGKAPCEKIFSVFYRKAKDVGDVSALRAQRFNVLKDTRSTLLTDKGIPDASWRQSSLDVSQNIMDDFAAGKIGSVDELPSVTRWNDEFFGTSGNAGSIPKGRGLDDAVEVHHTVEKWIQGKLGLSQTDDVPGAVLLKKTGQPDGHAALQGRLRSEITGLSNSDDIVRAMRDVYQSRPEWTNLWPAAEKWLQGKGIPIPN